MQSTPFDVSDLCVRAGAGAGKTTNLTEQVLQYALDFKAGFGRWPKVVVTTFTRKATQELRERLLLKALNFHPEALNFVRSRHLLTVSTMHGLMDSYLRSQGSKRGLSPQFSLLSSAQGRGIQRKVLRRLLKSEPQFQNLLQEVGFNQLLGHLGALRRSAMDGRQWNYFKHEDFERQTVDSFEKTVVPLQKMLKEMAHYKLRPEWQSLCAQISEILKSYFELSWEEFQVRLSSVVPEIKKPRAKKEDPPEVAEMTQDLAEWLKQLKKFAEPTYRPSYWNKLEKNFSLFSELSERFEACLEEDLFSASQIQLDDLEIQTYRLLSEHPESAQEFGSRWDYWLIDEYQDTSPIQVRILEEWIQDRPLYVVGDPQQSIYLFRGARREVFFDMWNRTQSRGKTLSLQKNYRSDPDLLEFINWCMKPLGDSFEAMTPKADTQKQEWISALMPAQDDHSEWYQIKRQILDLLEVKKVRPDQITVLARTRKELEKLAQNMQSSGIPYYLHGGSSFLFRREVQDILLILRFLLNPWDDLSLTAFCRTPWVGLSDERLHELSLTSGGSLWSKLKSHGQSWPEVKLLKRLHERRDHRDLLGVMFDFCRERQVFETSFYMDPSGTREANLFKTFHWLNEHMQRPGANLLEVFEGLGDFSLDLETGESEALSTLEPNRIQLMTYHAAKGLEADYVFLPHLHKKINTDDWFSFTAHEDKCLWGFRTAYEDSEKELAHPGERDWVKVFKARQMEEGWRVFYVGLTRARKKLYLSWQESLSSPCPAELFQSSEEKLKNPDNKFLAHYCDPIDSEESFRISEKKYLSQGAGKMDEAGGPWREELSFITESSNKTSVTQELGQTFKPRNLDMLKKGIRSSLMGERVHRLFELLKFSSMEQIEKFLPQWFGDDVPEVLKALKYVKDHSEPSFSKLIETGEVEWSFLVQWQGQVLEGQVDLYGRDGDGNLWVVDYKTGNSKYKSKAFEQLAIYAKALEITGTLKPGEKFYLCALYPFEGNCFIKEERLSVE